MQLRDKAILVTGSTTGLGEAIARRAIAEGARVMLHGRDRKRGEALVAELDGKAAFHADELSDPQAASRLIDAAVSQFGKLDALVNNAAWVVRSRLADTDAQLFDKVMAINVRAPLLLIRAAIEHLKRSRGAVLNIGSINAYCGENNLLAYSVSKGALLTLSRNLADAHCYDNVRFTHFNVGWVLTENEYRYKIQDGLDHDWHQKVPRELAPSGRLLKPEEVAAASVFWLSDDSRPISGTVMELEQYPFLGRNPTREKK